MSQMNNPGASVPVFDQADRLAKAIQWSGISVQEMADELGVSRNTVGNYINRRTQVPRAVKIVWALKTGVPLEWLETGDAPRPEGPEGGQRACRDSNPKPSDWESNAPDEPAVAPEAEVIVFPSVHPLVAVAS